MRLGGQRDDHSSILAVVAITAEARPIWQAVLAFSPLCRGRVLAGNLTKSPRGYVPC